MLSAGLLISAPWVGITMQGWSAMRRHAGLAGTFAYLLHASSQSIRRDHLQPRADPDLLPNLAGDPRFVLMYLGPGYIHLSLG